MKTEYIITIIGIVVPAITSIILFYLASKKDNKVTRKSVLEERMKELYIPFYHKYFNGMLMKIKLSSMSVESQLTIMEELSKKIQYMKTSTQELYFNFYLSQLDMFEALDGNKDFPLEKVSKEYDDNFNKLSISLLKEYENICKELKLPKPLKKDDFK